VNDPSPSVSLAVSSQSAPAPQRVFVADDHPVLARLLADYVRGSAGPAFTFAGLAHDGETALRACAQGAVDLLVLDIGLPGLTGLEVLQKLRSAAPRVRTLIFSAQCTEQTVQTAFGLGAAGFVEKTATFEELVVGLRALADGRTAFGPAAMVAMRSIVRRGASPTPLAADEMAVLRLLHAGQCAKEIAPVVGLSVSGTYKLITRVRRKICENPMLDLGVVLRAAPEGVITLPPTGVARAVAFGR
jgi:DNA-binding NarL/FixJ family response regulator